MSERFHLSLDGDWQFWTDSQAVYTVDTLPEDEATQMLVPASWQREARFRDYTGVAWYRRRFDLPADWLASRAVVLGFGAVDYLAEVWVNGQPAGEHEGGYLPFECEVTRWVRTGENSVVVRVSDPAALFAEIPHGKQSWYGMLSGIWQPTWLESRAVAHIQQVKITPVAESVTVDVAMSAGLQAGESLQLEIFAPDGALAMKGESASLHYECQVEEALRWDLDSPYLYRLRASLVNRDGCVVDTCESSFGFRTIATRDGKILLNGRAIYLRAALDQDYYPDGLGSLPSVEFIEAEFLKAKAMGLNCLRTHIKIADPRYYEAADKLGLLIWTELPNWITLSAAAQQRARQTLFGMVERDWNHPCIIIWTIVNESWGVDLSNPEHRRWLSQMYHDLKSLDPFRLVVGNSACWGNFHVVTDLEDFHNYYAMPDHSTRWRDWVAALARRPGWTFAHPYTDYASWREFLRAPWEPVDRATAEEVQRQGDEPLLVSEFGNWGLPDVPRLLREYGQEPWWFESGMSFGDGVVYPHGVLQRFTEYGFGRSFADFSALAEAHQWLQFAGLKYEIEQIRQHASLQGYVITEFSDILWESNGLLDMLRQPKVHYAALGYLNQDDVILPETGQRVITGGQALSVDLRVSHYSQKSARHSRIEWRLLNELEGGQAQGGEIPVGDAEMASVTRLPPIQVLLPAVEQITPMRLDLRWKPAEGAQLAQNELEVLLFPTRKAPARQRIFAAERLRAALRGLGYPLVETIEEADIAVTDCLDDAYRSALLEGRRVLWLAENQDSLQTNVPGLRVVNRQGSAWQGDWASSLSWINRDRMFGALPGSGMVDFMFQDLTPEQVLVGFSPREFWREVQAGLCVGWLHKPVALIAERVVGRGRLLACTFRLAEHLQDHPLAVYLLDEMLTSLVEA